MHTSRREFLVGSAVTGLTTLYAPEALAYSPADNADGAAHQMPGAMTTSTTDSAYSRGVGVYPGDPSEYAGAFLVPAVDEYRNLALHRPAYHSSSYDYNLTAQLITDGITSTEMPSWITVSIQNRILPKEEREAIIDHEPVNLVRIAGHQATVDLHLGGGQTVPEVDRIELFLVVPNDVAPAGLRFQISVSANGHAWQQVSTAAAGEALPSEKYPPEMVHGANVFSPVLPFSSPARSRFYRVELISAPPAEGFSDSFLWQLGQVAFFKGTSRVQIGGPYSFTSAWRGALLDEEWVYVDLLAACAVDAVKLHWIAPPVRGSLQVSDDAVQWRDLRPLTGTTPVEEIHFATANARYVRVLMTHPSSDAGYILSEMEVFGRGGVMAKPQPPRVRSEDGTLLLSGGDWKLQRDSLVQASGKQLATVGFDAAAWLPATVPGTTLTSYLDAGAIPDPNFGSNQLYISDSFFYADFWYRTEFQAPRNQGDLAWLHLDGVNWKAEVFLNGETLGRVDGAFYRGRFDVTGKLKTDQANALAVRIEKNATPGSVHQKTYETPSKNGGGLGADNPTFHASVGWDWIPTVRGRNTGLWNNVRIVHTGTVTLEDPLVCTVVSPQNALNADVTISIRVRNHGARAVQGTVAGSLGEISFSRDVTLPPHSEQTVTFDPGSTPVLRMRDAKLWWSTGYGEPYLYDVELQFQPKRGQAFQPLKFKAGLRQMTSSSEDGRLRLFINGRRFIVRGGNWGFSESMLRYRAREYDAAVRYHREMNFNTVRNWVGQIGEEAFYDACDRHGIVVWQDFWLANPWDGPIPEDNALFLNNARDLVNRIRRHASIGLYCGRNEWFPPGPLEVGLRGLLAELHPDICYIPSSADGTVSGHGPYNTLSVVQYFRRSDSKLHSEIGAPCIPPLESVRAMMPKSALWPQGLEYGLHDFTLQGAQGATSLLALIDNVYGGATSAADWIALAQFLNYETYRAMFEAQSRDRMGVLLWMSHPCWPSFVWQTYDYFLEPTAAYFGCKKACEAVHIQWNPLTDMVEVVNYNAGRLQELQATAQLLNPDGTSIWEKAAILDSNEDSSEPIFAMQYRAVLAQIHFCRLTLRQGDRVLSTNTYLRAREEGNLRAIRNLGQATVTLATQRKRRGNSWQLIADVQNTAKVVAVMTHVKAIGSEDGDRILPAIYNDNYFTLMPQERRTITVELQQADTRRQAPEIVLEGFNVVMIRV